MTARRPTGLIPSTVYSYSDPISCTQPTRRAVLATLKSPAPFELLPQTVMYLRNLCFLATAVVATASQISFANPGGLAWRSLGPFPLGTREGPILPPLLPEARDRYSTPMVDGGYITTWGESLEGADGFVQVEDMSVRWSDLRFTQGWTALQHQVFYERTLAVPSDSIYSFSLTTAAEFSLSRLDSEDAEVTWYAGNMYTYPDAPPHYVQLEAGEYRLTVTYVHDIRIAGEAQEDGVPRGTWRMEVNEVQAGIVSVEGKNVVPSLVQGRAMGSVVGVELRNVGTETVEVIDVDSDDPYFDISLLDILPNHRPITLAPFQTLSVPLNLSQRHSIPLNTSHAIQLALNLSSGVHFVTLTLHPSPSTPSVPIAFTSTCISSTLTPTYALYLPPLSASRSCASATTILALHGAGTDPAVATEWTTSIAPRKENWVVLPLGMTAWGHDWHGGSLRDSRMAVGAVDGLRERWEGAWGMAERECDSGRGGLMLFGHSNGGQGAWYFLSHFPDEVIGGVPASAYVKIQDYVPFHLSVGQHYRDPALTAIMQAALTPFDNDLYATNLVGIPILCRHGGIDDNVAVQHSRQFITIIDAWSANSTAEYSEAPGELHWFDSVFRTPIVDSFVDNLLTIAPTPSTELDFTVTTANPDESGSKNGFKILEMEVPGRLARIQVSLNDSTAVLNSRNVRTFSLDTAMLRSKLGSTITSIRLDGGTPIPVHGAVMTLRVSFRQLSIAEASHPIRRYGPLISILSTPTPLVLVVGTRSSPAVQQHLTSIATRIAHDAYLYAKIGCRIVLDVDFEEEKGNVVLIGDASSNEVIKTWSKTWPTPISYPSDHSSAFAVHDRVFETEGQSLLFVTPNPNDVSGLALVLGGIGWDGLESAYRLFPVRTGVALPDWVVSTRKATTGGLEAAGFWGPDWGYSDRASYL